MYNIYIYIYRYSTTYIYIYMYIYTHMHNYIYALRIYTHARTHICVDHCQGKSKTTEPSAGSYRLDSDTEGLGSKDGGFKVNASAGLHKGAVHKVLCSCFFQGFDQRFCFWAVRGF